MSDTNTPTVEELATRVAALEARPKRVVWAEADIIKTARALALMRRGYEVDRTGCIVGPYSKDDRERFSAYLQQDLLSRIDALIDAAMLAGLAERAQT